MKQESHLETTPGTVRPGGRTAKVRAAVLRATEDALAADGFHALAMDRIAAGAGVGKTTVYRRWASPVGLVADLLRDMAERSVPAADTGSLEGDLRANAALVTTTLTDPRMGPVFRAVIAAAACDEECATALRGFYETRLRAWAPTVERAAERGEAPAGTDPLEVLRAVSAPLYYRFAVSHEPLTGADGDRAVAAALAATRAGVFVRP
ncbi:TetR/AcrR family transcriptional regulator [Streptomyces sp. WAC05374]|uniref:TetR/AcrR family transcriptional regulator n=1 Tax=Streptomyces sp. WAC05374 TaxID=2487420 RepID=UPI000F8656BC|nr:TetR/AcrR family transcriptional regulator [Streptomyces sp. WAC05374]RST18801.1 TetR/AcrR family transcriptional regulator [Streptomyces sp. WAC05374]TDF43177.1 TetR/AcrR family transcriptional regulator [Streptomyces sp. WAC05374]TDF50963.1 TetR/AcrR family transcriptional regulator [Streptomyces sp. WAC05374]TDF52294.1 TetR/AcrR family transcriptional regulator [Streptomyces sp. WAC05374]